MPSIKVTVPSDAWSIEQKKEIVKNLTQGLNQVAESSGKGDITPYINVHIHETAAGGYAMGGEVIG